ncbi:hypothetical protein GGI00_003958, partial [Coemansia sp. RSA 2681]
QTARYLVAQVRAIRAAKDVADNDTTRYLRRHLSGAFSPKSVSSLIASPDAQLDLLSFRAATMAAAMVDAMDGAEQRSWNRSLVAAQRLCDAHSDFVVASYFRQHLASLPPASPLRPHLEKLATLMFLYTLEQHSADLFRLPGAAAFTPQMVADVENSLADIIEDVRGQAVPLVDAFGVSDFRLNSALGRSDGKVYENYLQWAMEDPLNQEESGSAIRKDWFNKYYKPVLHPEETKSNNKPRL